jgi:hypothetical protein
MGENPLVSDGKQFTSSLMENAHNLSENVVAGMEISRPSFSHSATQTPFWKLVVDRDCSELCSRDRLKKIYLIILVIKRLCLNFKLSAERIWSFLLREREERRKWHQILRKKWTSIGGKKWEEDTKRRINKMRKITRGNGISLF